MYGHRLKIENRCSRFIKSTSKPEIPIGHGFPENPVIIDRRLSTKNF